MTLVELIGGTIVGVVEGKSQYDEDTLLIETTSGETVTVKPWAGMGGDTAGLEVEA